MSIKLLKCFNIGALEHVSKVVNQLDHILAGDLVSANFEYFFKMLVAVLLAYRKVLIHINMLIEDIKITN